MQTKDEPLSQFGTFFYSEHILYWSLYNPYTYLLFHLLIYQEMQIENASTPTNFWQSLTLKFPET